MRKSTLILALGAAVSLSACASGGLFNRDRPDEFAVGRQAPLVVPPDFGLNPPQPGAPRPGTESTGDQTLRALFGGPAPRSGSETSLINDAGGARADAAIRSTVGDPATNSVDKGTVVRNILSAPQGAGQYAIADAPQN